ncbi:Helix-turn-helix [Selenomonas sp. WCT3]|uniref:helix-turn-helix domain-containing protein n=1 Tax=Selenomonas sp. WCT3 TaxID=3158785 RepID=UPI00088DBFA4|nr:Helix-turn-helix [Selenomonas ruminantium]
MEFGNIGQYIRARRKEVKMSQVELGGKVGKSSQVISKWERGYTQNVSVDDLAKIAQALEVSPAYFFPEQPNTKNQCPSVVDKRLQYVIDNYPQLNDKAKDLIDSVIFMAKLGKR